MLGTCIYCGQQMVTELENEDQANKYATDNCKCKEGQNYRSKLDAIEKSIADLGYCFNGMPDKVIEAWGVILEAMYNDLILSVSIKTEDGATTKLTRKVSSVKIKKTDSHNIEFENYEL